MIEIENKFFSDNNINHYSYDIYHYTSPEGLLGILDNNSLRFTNAFFLNDKSEFRYTYKLLLEILPSIQQDIDKTLFESLRTRAEYVTGEDFYKHESEVLFREDFYIMSFSKDSDNLALWNNYTKSSNKTGYNIKFITDNLIAHLKEILNDTFIESSLVCYNIEKQKKALIDLIKYYNNLVIEKQNRELYTKKLICELIVYSLFFKHPKFIVENEYRIIIGNIAHIDDKNLGFNIKNGLFIPCLSCPLKEDKSIDGKLIEEIKVSPIADRELIQYSLNKVLNKTGYNFVPITFSDIPLRY